jgi:hypothetical protein
MKKHYYLGALLITILALIFTVAASPSNPGKAVREPRFIQLMATRFIKHKGYVFIFQVSGGFKKTELIGTVNISGQIIKMYCVRRDDSLVACTASHLKKHVGEQVWVVLAGYGHAVIIPIPRVNNSESSCYPVYDWPKPHTDHTWDHFADYCQVDLPQVGDAIDLYNPTWNGTYTYIYQTSAPCSDQGNGYYYGVSAGDYYSIQCP